MSDAALQISTMRLGLSSDLRRESAALVFSLEESVVVEFGERMVEKWRRAREAWRRREKRDMVGV